jgi:hypothetical protein
MSWAMSFANMKSVHSFAAAEKVWKEAREWKNEHTNRRPLAEYRAKHKMIKKINDGAAYQMVLYTTPLVTYFMDGSVELQTYNTQASRTFSCYCNPQNCEVEHVGEKMYWKYLSQEGYRYIRQGSKPLYLQYVGTGTYDLLTSPAVDTEQKLDLKKAAAVRKTLKQFKLWQQVNDRLENRTHAYSRWGDINRLMKDPLNYELYPELTLSPIQSEYAMAYTVAGATTCEPVPYIRLPRRQK